MKPLRSPCAEIRDWLASGDFAAEPVVAIRGEPLVLDLARGSTLLGEPLPAPSVERFSELIDAAMRRAGARFAFGRWGEDRDLYTSAQFAGNDGQRRSVHLGLDLFCAAGTPICAPLPGVVEIVANNARELDYGPLVIVRHATPGGLPFWTLYGHLADSVLRSLRAGMPLAAGAAFAAVGAPPDNGNWPPHLHFQLVLDLLGLGRDFPGVASPREQRRWFALSPNPACFFPEVPAAALDGRAAAV